MAKRIPLPAGFVARLANLRGICERSASREYEPDEVGRRECQFESDASHQPRSYAACAAPSSQIIGEREGSIFWRRTSDGVKRVGRVVSAFAAHLVDRVLPEVPVRQWVLTLSCPLRHRCSWNARLTRVDDLGSHDFRAEERMCCVDERGILENRFGSVDEDLVVGPIRAEPRHHRHLLRVRSERSELARAGDLANRRPIRAAPPHPRLDRFRIRLRAIDHDRRARSFKIDGHVVPFESQAWRDAAPSAAIEFATGIRARARERYITVRTRWAKSTRAP